MQIRFAVSSQFSYKRTLKLGFINQFEFCTPSGTSGVFSLAKMTRLCVTILATIILYLAYQTLASEAVPTGNGGGGGSSKLLSGSVDSSDNLLSDENLNKLQTAWLKSTYQRRSSGPVGPAGGSDGRAVASYPALRRTAPAAIALPNPMGYLADISLIDDEDIQKRFDDYGHMRFGKRGGEGDQFDDYGHMRFGRR